MEAGDSGFRAYKRADRVKARPVPNVGLTRVSRATSQHRAQAHDVGEPGVARRGAILCLGLAVGGFMSADHDDALAESAARVAVVALEGTLAPRLRSAGSWLLMPDATPMGVEGLVQHLVAARKPLVCKAWPLGDSLAVSCESISDAERLEGHRSFSSRLAEDFIEAVKKRSIRDLGEPQVLVRGGQSSIVVPVSAVAFRFLNYRITRSTVSIRDPDAHARRLGAVTVLHFGSSGGIEVDAEFRESP